MKLKNAPIPIPQAVVAVSVITLIGFACWVTHSADPLVWLILLPFILFLD